MHDIVNTGSQHCTLQNGIHITTMALISQYQSNTFAHPKVTQCSMSKLFNKKDPYNKDVSNKATCKLCSGVSFQGPEVIPIL